jgi:clan AA aspartic protease
MGLTRIPVTLRVPGSSNGAYHAAFLVDTGATDSMAPASELVKAGIQPVGRKTYELADGRVVDYEFGLAQIEFMSEITAGRVIFGPEAVEPILGVTALESAGLLVDPVTHVLRRLPAIPLK